MIHKNLLTILITLMCAIESPNGADQNALAGVKKPVHRLDPLKRPQELQMITEQNFKAVERNNYAWNVIANDHYGILGLDMHELLAGIIRTSPERRDFYVLDLGAGNFAWGESLAKFINKTKDIGNEVTVHILSVRGEHYNLVPKKLGKCIIYNIGSFDIQNLSNSFGKIEKTLGFDANSGVIDLIVSHFTFMHINDPVGTLVESYNILRPNGLIVADGFPVLFGPRDSGAGSRKNMIELLAYTGKPFLLKDSYDTGFHFILQHSNDHSLLTLPFTYGSTTQMQGNRNSFHKDIAYFLIDQNAPKYRATPLVEENTLIGDEILYINIKNIADQLTTRHF